MEVVWTENALATFLRVVDYLFENWTIREVEIFEDKVYKLIRNIANHNKICPESKLFGYRKCLIDEYNSLIYDIINEKLLLIAFIDNRSNHVF
jgi:plasmid stabilization system protein ParE